MDIEILDPPPPNVWSVHAIGRSRNMFGNGELPLQELIYQGPDPELAKRFYFEITAVSLLDLDVLDPQIYAAAIWPLLNGTWTPDSDFRSADPAEPFGWAARGWFPDSLTFDEVDAHLEEAQASWTDEHGAVHPTKIRLSAEEKLCLAAFEGATADDGPKLRAAMERLALSATKPGKRARPRKPL